MIESDQHAFTAPRQQLPPRVLIISVNPLSSTQNNGKTYQSLFVGYPKASVAQLFFYPADPSYEACDRYYRINDSDVLGRVLGRRMHGRLPTTPATTSAALTPRAHLASSGPGKARLFLKRSSFARLLRLVFLSAFTDIEGEPDVIAWLDEFRPEVIFLSGGQALHLYQVCAVIARRYGCRVVTYITDDYILPSWTLNPSKQVLRWWIRRVFLRTARSSDAIITIGQRMSDVYRAKYGIESTHLMNSINKEVAQEPPASPPLRLAYIGGLHTGRWRALAALAEAVSNLHNEGIRCTLDVYCVQRPADRILRLLHRPPASTFRGGIGPDEVREVLRASHVLVHVESPRRSDTEVTRLSVSTKIAEYLVAGRCVLAIGPEDVASIQYLRSLDVGPVISRLRPGVIEQELRTLYLHPELMSRYARDATDAANRFHDAARTRREFQWVLSGFRP